MTEKAKGTLENIGRTAADAPPVTNATAAKGPGVLEKVGQDTVVGYILAPEALVVLLELCEDLPYRYSKKIVPTLQSSSQLVEGADGTARVVSPNRG